MNRKGHFSFDMGPVGNFIFLLVFWVPFLLGSFGFFWPAVILWTIGAPTVMFLVVRRLFRK